MLAESPRLFLAGTDSLWPRFPALRDQTVLCSAAAMRSRARSLVDARSTSGFPDPWRVDGLVDAVRNGAVGGHVVDRQCGCSFGSPLGWIRLSVSSQTSASSEDGLLRHFKMDYRRTRRRSPGHRGCPAVRGAC